jgi:hypothetical protein
VADGGCAVESNLETNWGGELVAVVAGWRALVDGGDDGGFGWWQGGNQRAQLHLQALCK